MNLTRRNIEILAMFDSKIRQKIIAVQFGIGVRQVKRIIHQLRGQK